MRIVIAPLSNDHLRDWPLENFRRLAAACVDQLDAEILFVGSAAQRCLINCLVRGHEVRRVRNYAARISWSQVQELLLEADATVANNSGVAHLSAILGKPTLCLFSASHVPFEWKPQGPRVVTLFTKTSCAPCGNTSREGCPFCKRCLSDITPELAFSTLCDLLPVHSDPLRPLGASRLELPRRDPARGASLTS